MTTQEEHVVAKLREIIEWVESGKITVTEFSMSNTLRYDQGRPMYENGSVEWTVRG